jgi:hypothetical protein
MSKVVSVECYSGARFAERPLALTWNDERLSIESIERAWQTPDGVAFVVRADGLRFELTYLSVDDQWTARPLDDSASIFDI